MPEWAQSVLSIGGAAVGAWVAIRVELRFVWRDLSKLDGRIAELERAHGPRRRATDWPRVRRDP